MLSIPRESFDAFANDGASWKLMEKLTQLPESSTNKQRWAFMRGFTMVTFVRHPFTRLVSAYQEKILDRSWYVEDLLKLHSNTEVINGVPTFSQFVEYVLDQDPDKVKLNVHIEVMWQRCNVCQVNYDFIGKMETYDQDMNLLLDHVSKQLQNKTKNILLTFSVELSNCYRPLDVSRQQKQKEK